MTAFDEPNCEVEECACCGGSIYTCLWCGFETTRSDVMDDHECEPPPAGVREAIELHEAVHGPTPPPALVSATSTNMSSLPISEHP